MTFVSMILFPKCLLELLHKGKLCHTLPCRHLMFMWFGFLA